MRTFVVTRNGTARVARTYALGPGGRSITPDIEGQIEEITPAPDMADEVARWHPSQFAEVTATREISEADIPALRDAFLRDAWEDDGTSINVNMVKARASFERELREAKLGTARELNDRETIGEDVTSEKAALRATNPNSSAAATPQALRALWPATLPRTGKP